MSANDVAPREGPVLTCTNCGSPLTGTRYCGECGAPAPPPDEANQVPVTAVESDEDHALPSEESTTETPPDTDLRGETQTEPLSGETKSTGGSGSSSKLAETGQMLLGLAFLAGVGWVIAWWTGTWWSLIVIPVAIGIVAGLTALMPEQYRAQMGCLFTILMFVGLVYLFPAWRQAANNNKNRPVDKPYTQDAFLRCKDIIYGSDYPEDRLTSIERDVVVKCAQGSSP